MCLDAERIEFLLSNLADKVLLIADKMVGNKAVAVLAFCVAIVLVEASGHMRARIEVTAVEFIERFHTATGDATAVAESIGFAVTKADELREHPVERLDIGRCGPPLASFSRLGC